MTFAFVSWSNLHSMYTETQIAPKTNRRSRSNLNYGEHFLDIFRFHNTFGYNWFHVHLAFESDGPVRSRNKVGTFTQAFNATTYLFSVSRSSVRTSFLFFIIFSDKNDLVIRK